VRKAITQDLSAIMTIEEQSFAEPTREQEETFRRRISAFPEGFLVLSDADTAVCGYFCSELWNHVPTTPAAFTLGHDASRSHVPAGTVLYISSIAILPECRGSGTGHRFLQQCLDSILAAHPQITDLVLLVNSHWPAARHLYTTLGFQPYGTIPSFFRECNGAGADGVDEVGTVGGDGDGIMMRCSWKDYLNFR